MPPLPTSSATVPTESLAVSHHMLDRYGPAPTKTGPWRTETPKSRSRIRSTLGLHLHSEGQGRSDAQILELAHASTSLERAHQLEVNQGSLQFLDRQPFRDCPHREDRCSSRAESELLSPCLQYR